MHCVNLKLINNHHTKILRKSTLKFIEDKYPKLLHELRVNRVRGNNYIQYLFFSINVDNILNNNIILNRYNDVIVYHLGNKEKLEHRTVKLTLRHEPLFNRETFPYGLRYIVSSHPFMPKPSDSADDRLPSNCSRLEHAQREDYVVRNISVHSE